MTAALAAWWPAHIEDAVEAISLQPGDWTHEVDVAIVGYGGAGVCAAIEAREAGLEVLALDRTEGGGATRINGGVVYAGGGTTTQVEAGVTDTPEDMFNYLRQETDGVVSDETLKRFCWGSVGDHDWLTRHGVGFPAKLYRGKTSYPPTQYYLYHSDSSLAQTYADKARPAPRGHRVDMPAQNRADGYGRGFYDPLKLAAQDLGVQLKSYSLVTALIRNTQGRVVGVRAYSLRAESEAARQMARHQAQLVKLTALPESAPFAKGLRRKAERLSEVMLALWRSQGEVFNIKARHGVILAAGGHIYNRAMVRHFSPDYGRGLALGTPGDDGSGVALGLTVKGAITGMDRISAWRFINPPFVWAKAPLVNGDGNRFIDETFYGAAIGKAMCDGRDGRAYIILDRPLLKEARKQAGAQDVLPFQKWPALAAMLMGHKRSQDLAGLAKKISVPAEALLEAVSQHNAVAKGDMPDPFGKRGSDAAALGSGPYYAIDVSINATFFPLPTLTLGGLKLDETTGQVLNDEGQAIGGLYAAGRSAIGLCSNLYVSGLSVADCVFSGRRAAKSIIQHKA